MFLYYMMINENNCAMDYKVDDINSKV